MTFSINLTKVGICNQGIHEMNPQRKHPAGKSTTDADSYQYLKSRAKKELPHSNIGTGQTDVPALGPFKQNAHQSDQETVTKLPLSG